MLTYYVTPATGSDANSAAQATNPATPWATLNHALATCDSATDSCTILLADSVTHDPGGYLPLNRVNAHPVLVRPVTLPANYGYGATIQGVASPGGNALLRHYNASFANLAFQGLRFVGPANGPIVWFSTTAFTGTNLAFTDCTFTQTADQSLVWGDLSGSGLTFTRCTFPITYGASRYAIQLGSSTPATVCNGITIDSCLFSDALGSGGPFLLQVCNGLIVRNSHFRTNGTALEIGDQNNLGSRITNVLVERNVVYSLGLMHGIYVNADGAVIRDNTSINGDYSLVLKWGTGYEVYGNFLSRIGGQAGNACAVIKGAHCVSFHGNALYSDSGYDLVVEQNDADSNRASDRVSITDNTFTAAGTCSAVPNWVTAATNPALGHVHCDRNRYVFGGSGVSNFMGAANVNSLAGIQAAWQAAGAGYAANDLSSQSGIVSGAADTAEILATLTAGVTLDLTQPLPDSQAATVGGALAAAHATGWGKVVKDVLAKTLGVWGPGNATATASKMFNLDNGLAPTSRS